MEQTQQTSPSSAEAPAPSQDLLQQQQLLSLPLVEGHLDQEEVALQNSTAAQPLAGVDKAPNPEPANLQEALAQLDVSQLTLKQKIGLKILQRRLKKEAKIAGTDSPQGNKSQIVALLLCFFLGLLGIHRFYLGYTGIGVIQLLTAGLCGIWTLIDFIRLCVGDLQPKNGSYDEALGSGGSRN